MTRHIFPDTKYRRNECKFRRESAKKYRFDRYCFGSAPFEGCHHGRRHHCNREAKGVVKKGIRPGARPEGVDEGSQALFQGGLVGGVELAGLLPQLRGEGWGGGVGWSEGYRGGCIEGEKEVGGGGAAGGGTGPLFYLALFGDGVLSHR